MNEFDEIVAVRRIHDLMLRKRGVERTHTEIRRTAKVFAYQCQVTYDVALARWERILLTNNPKPEKWDD